MYLGFNGCNRIINQCHVEIKEISEYSNNLNAKFLGTLHSLWGWEVSCIDVIHLSYCILLFLAPIFVCENHSSLFMVILSNNADAEGLLDFIAVE